MGGMFKIDPNIGMSWLLLQVSIIHGRATAASFVISGSWPTTYVSLQLRLQNRRRKWNFPLNFCTMRKLSAVFQNIPELLVIQSSGCASGVDYFRNFTKLKNLNF